MLLHCLKLGKCAVRRDVGGALGLVLFSRFLKWICSIFACTLIDFPIPPYYSPVESFVHKLYKSLEVSGSEGSKRGIGWCSGDEGSLVVYKPKSLRSTVRLFAEG